MGKFVKCESDCVVCLVFKQLEMLGNQFIAEVSHGRQEGSQEGLQNTLQDSQEEGGGWRQGQEEEVVQGKIQGQAEQPGAV